jgi:hypothetical protein
MLDTTERASVDERYEVACNASSLVVSAEKGGPGDVLIAAGWSDSRIGMALLRLHSEWDGAAKPARLSEPQIKVLAAKFRDDEAKAKESARARGKPYTPQGSPGSRARTEAMAWYRRELRLLAQSLKTRGVVIEQLTAWALIKGVDAAAVGPAGHHWLAPTCSVCDGLGQRKAPDAPALSGKVCHACSGTGNAYPPNGSGRLLAHIDYVVQVARQSLKRRLRHT